jgi:hypothetical protein
MKDHPGTERLDDDYDTGNSLKNVLICPNFPEMSQFKCRKDLISFNLFIPAMLHVHGPSMGTNSFMRPLNQKTLL